MNGKHRDGCRCVPCQMRSDRGQPRLDSLLDDMADDGRLTRVDERTRR